MRKGLTIIAIGAAALLSGCATTGSRIAPVDVTRFHLGGPIERTTVSVEAVSTGSSVSLEYQAYIDAVTTQLQGQGYVRSTSDRPSGYIASVEFTRKSLGTVRKRPPITIGLGGGSYSGGRGGGVGVGGGASFGIGGGNAEVIGTELAVTLRRRSDNSTVWEGRAVTEGIGEASASGPTAERLATALFKGFPGESGITITVK